MLWTRAVDAINVLVYFVVVIYFVIPAISQIYVVQLLYHVSNFLAAVNTRFVNKCL